MKFFAEYKSTILLLITTIIFGYILGLSISTVVDYRLRDAIINLPKPKNNIILNVDKTSHKLIAKEKFVDYDSDLEEYKNPRKHNKSNQNRKRNSKKNTDKKRKVENIESEKKMVKKSQKKQNKKSKKSHNNIVKRQQDKKLKNKSGSKNNKNNKKIKSSKKTTEEGFENYDAVEMGNNYSKINSNFKLKSNGKLFVNLTQKDTNLNRYSDMYNSNKKEPKVNFLEAANQEDTDQTYESIFKK